MEENDKQIFSKTIEIRELKIKAGSTKEELEMIEKINKSRDRYKTFKEIFDDENVDMIKEVPMEQQMIEELRKIQPISEIQEMEEKLIKALSNELSNEIQKKIRELQEKNNTEFKYGQE